MNAKVRVCFLGVYVMLPTINFVSTFIFHEFLATSLVGSSLLVGRGEKANISSYRSHIVIDSYVSLYIYMHASGEQSDSLHVETPTFQCEYTAWLSRYHISRVT